MRKERLFFAIAFGLIGVTALSVLQPFLTYVLMAAILTYTLFPVYRFLHDRTRNPAFSSSLCIVLTLIAIILPAIFIVSQLVEQVSGAYTSFQIANIQRAADYLSGLTGNRVNFQEMVESTFDQIRTSVIGFAPDVLGSVTGISLGLFVMFFIMYYAFREGAAFVERIKELLPLDTHLKESLFFEMRTVTQAVLYGQVMTAVIQGSIGGLAFLVFGIPNWIFWGVIMIILSFLPFVGTPLVWVPAAVGKLIEGEMGNGVGLLIVGATIVMNVDNFIRPRLVSGRSQIHPVMILIGVLGGLKVFGFVGMLLGPLTLALLVVFVRFYEQNYLRKATESAAD